MRRPEDLRVRLSSRAPARGTGSSADARARRPRCRTAPVAPRPEAPRRARGRAPLRWVRIASDFECVNVSDECCPSAVGGRCVQLESARVDARCDVLRATRGGFLGELPLVASPRARASEEQARTHAGSVPIRRDRSLPPERRDLASCGAIVLTRAPAAKDDRLRCARAHVTVGFLSGAAHARERTVCVLARAKPGVARRHDACSAARRSRQEVPLVHVHALSLISGNRPRPRSPPERRRFVHRGCKDADRCRSRAHRRARTLPRIWRSRTRNSRTARSRAHATRLSSLRGRGCDRRPRGRRGEQRHPARAATHGVTLTIASAPVMRSRSSVGISYCRPLAL
jgi:hypothetical protein